MPSSVADERLQRMDAREQADEIVLPAQREHRVDQVVADAGFALLDLEAVVEEVEEPRQNRSPSAHVEAMRRAACRERNAMPDRRSLSIVSE